VQLFCLHLVLRFCRNFGAGFLNFANFLQSIVWTFYDMFEHGRRRTDSALSCRFSDSRGVRYGLWARDKEIFFFQQGKRLMWSPINHAELHDDLIELGVIALNSDIFIF
jgi:hypothetical protein